MLLQRSVNEDGVEIADDEDGVGFLVIPLPFFVLG